MNSTTRNIKELSEGEHVTLTFGAFKYVYLLALDEEEHGDEDDSCPVCGMMILADGCGCIYDDLDD